MELIIGATGMLGLRTWTCRAAQYQFVPALATLLDRTVMCDVVTMAPGISPGRCPTDPCLGPSSE